MVTVFPSQVEASVGSIFAVVVAAAGFAAAAPAPAAGDAAGEAAAPGDAAAPGEAAATGEAAGLAASEVFGAEVGLAGAAA
jgi:hypothetical protein